MDVETNATGEVRPQVRQQLDPAALMHRWFVQYNPMYLASAACVLVGIYLISDGLGGVESRSNELWLIPVVQTYEVLLIVGAALLYRVAGLRRPAVILALVEVVYLCDVTFQTEVAAYLGSAGLAASAGWAVALPLKLAALAWALRLRLSASAVALPALGGLLVAAMPHVLYHRLLTHQQVTTVIVCCVFGLVAAWARLRPTIISREELDDWGATVLTRASRAIWILWGGFLLGHVAFWAHAHELGPGILLLSSAVLLATLRARRELFAWGGVALALGVGLLDPRAMSCTALLGAAALAVLARQGFVRQVADDELPTTAHPYRSTSETPEEPPRPAVTQWVPCPRLYVGAAVCVWLGFWTFGWQHWPLPAHLPWLDLGLTALLVAGAIRLRLYSGLIPAALIDLHLAASRDVGPSGKLQWGAMLVLAGFALLVGGVAISWALKQREGPVDGVPSGEPPGG
jgi:hypothetical protein